MGAERQPNEESAAEKLAERTEADLHPLQWEGAGWDRERPNHLRLDLVGYDGVHRVAMIPREKVDIIMGVEIMAEVEVPRAGSKVKKRFRAGADCTGQKAYEGWAGEHNWEHFNGDPIDPWEKVPLHQRKAWAAAQRASLVPEGGQ